MNKYNLSTDELGKLTEPQREVYALQKDRHDRTRAITHALINGLAEQLPDDNRWTAGTHYDGVRIRTTWGYREREAYIYALPHARGWSVFVDDYDKAAVYDWRNVAAQWATPLWQHPVWAPRDDPGPWKVPAEDVLAAVMVLVRRLQDKDARSKKWFADVQAAKARVNASR